MVKDVPQQREQVLHLVTDTERRGAQVFARDLVSELNRTDQKRHHRLMALQGAQPPTGSQLGLEFLSTSRRLSPRVVLRLRAMSESVGVVVAHGSTTLPASTIAFAGTGVPIIYRQISDSRFWAASFSRRQRVRLYLSRVRAIVALWDEAADTLSSYFGVPTGRIVVIPNAVPPPNGTTGVGLSAPGTGSTINCLYVGALVPEKGVDVAIDAVAAVADARLVVVGDGPMRRELEHAASLRAPGRVTFLGVLPDVEAAYAAADILLMPSRGGDSMPAVIIEAGLRRKAVIATRIGAAGSMLRHGETGLLCPPGDIEAMAAAIRRLGCRSAAVELGQRAQAEFIAAYSVEAVAPAWLALIDSVLRDGERRQRGQPEQGGSQA